MIPLIMRQAGAWALCTTPNLVARTLGAVVTASGVLSDQSNHIMPTMPQQRVQRAEIVSMRRLLVHSPFVYAWISTGAGSTELDGNVYRLITTKMFTTTPTLRQSGALSYNWIRENELGDFVPAARLCGESLVATPKVLPPT